MERKGISSRRNSKAKILGQNVLSMGKEQHRGCYGFKAQLVLVLPSCSHELFCDLESQLEQPSVPCNPKKQNTKPA